MTYLQPSGTHHFAEGYLATTTFGGAINQLITSTRSYRSTSTGHSDYGGSTTSSNSAKTEQFTVENGVSKGMNSGENGYTQKYNSVSANYENRNSVTRNTTSKGEAFWNTNSAEYEAKGDGGGFFSSKREGTGDRLTSNGATQEGKYGNTYSSSRSADYGQTIIKYANTQTSTSSGSIGNKDVTGGDSEDGYEYGQRNRTTIFTIEYVTGSTFKTDRNGTQLVQNSTKKNSTRGRKDSGGSPSSVYPATFTDYDYDDTNNGVGTPTTYEDSYEKITQSSSLGQTTVANYEVQYTDTQTTSSRFNYTIQTLYESKSTTTASTSIKITRTKPVSWDDPYEPFNITQTVYTYISETFDISNFFQGTVRTSIITGAAAWITGGTVMKNSLVTGAGTKSSVASSRPVTNFLSYSSNGNSGGNIKNATEVITTSTYSNFDLLANTNVQINRETSINTQLNGSSFEFGNRENFMAKGGAETANIGNKHLTANTRTNARRRNSEISNISGAFNVSSSGSYTYMTVASFSFFNTAGTTFYTNTARRTTFGQYTSHRGQNVAVDSDGNSSVVAYKTSENATSAGEVTYSIPIVSMTSTRYSEFGRATRATDNAFMQGEVWTIDKNPAYGGYQVEFESDISKAAKKYRDITIGDQLIKTTQINNTNVSPNAMTVNSAVSNKYVSSFNLPFFNAIAPLRLNTYFTFIPEGSYGNIYTSVSNGSASFEYLEDNESHVIYKYSKTYTVERSYTDGTGANLSMIKTSTDISILDGLVKVGNAVNFADGKKTTYFRQQVGGGFLDGHCFGGKSFSDKKGFSVIQGLPVVSYLFNSSGSQSLNSNSNSIENSLNETVSLPAQSLLFTHLPVGIDAGQNRPYFRRNADFRSVRD